MARILAYTTPATGHVFPLVPGLLALSGRGHEVKLVASPEHVGELRAAGLTRPRSTPARPTPSPTTRSRGATVCTAAFATCSDAGRSSARTSSATSRRGVPTCC
jgi:hypothetical protein